MVEKKASFQLLPESRDTCMLKEPHPIDIPVGAPSESHMIYPHDRFKMYIYSKTARL